VQVNDITFATWLWPFFHLCLHFVTRFNPCHFTRRQCIHYLIVISSRSRQKKLGMTLCAAELMRINEQMEMWIVTVDMYDVEPDVIPIPAELCWRNKNGTLQHLCINNRQFCIICRLKVCPAPVLHSSKTRQHSSRRTWKTPLLVPGWQWLPLCFRGQLF